MTKKSKEMLKKVITIAIVIVITAAVTTFLSVKTRVSPPTNITDTNTYNNLAVTGTPINNGEFISGGGTFRDVNLKLRVKVPVGWSIGLGGSGDTSENEFESEPWLGITSNSQPIPSGLLGPNDLIEAVSITRAKYESFEAAVAQYSEIDSKIVSINNKSVLLAGKYRAEEINIEYYRSEGGTESPMRFRTYLLVENGDYIYTINTVNTDFYNSEKVQQMLNSIEFYE